MKQRVVGGLVLVAIGAIVLPFVLDMHQDNHWWGKENIPKKPDNGFVTRVLPLEEWSKQTRTELAQARKEQANKPPVLTPPPVVAKPEASAPAAAPKPEAAPAPSGKTPEARSIPPAKEGWVVQLASFSSEGNAEDLRFRLQAKGYHVFVEPLQQGGRTIYRVRIGPESKRASADSLRDRVARDFKLKGIVLHTP